MKDLIARLREKLNQRRETNSSLAPIHKAMIKVIELQREALEKISEDLDDTIATSRIEILQRQVANCILKKTDQLLEEALK